MLMDIIADHLGRGGLVLAATHEQLGLPGTLELRLEAQ